MNHATLEQLEAGLDDIRSSPLDNGSLELIVRRPAIGAREVLDAGQLSTSVGLVGDTWIDRSSSRTADGSAHPDMQLNIMNARSARLIAGSPDRWALAGDQLYVDLDLTATNLPAGTRLSIGSAIVEITDQPHTGCAKFAERFGAVALRFVNIGEGKDLRMRGINARVVQSGSIGRGDAVTKLAP